MLVTSSITSTALEYTRLTAQRKLDIAISFAGIQYTAFCIHLRHLMAFSQAADVAREDLPDA
jgi:hypothetical protein